MAIETAIVVDPDILIQVKLEPKYGKRPPGGFDLAQSAGRKSMIA